MSCKIDPENPPFDFSRARHFTPLEREEFRKAIERKLNVKLPPRGRPPKKHHERYKPVFIRLHPKALAWARKEAKRRGVGYQTVINEALLKFAA
jgi:uncharacterized protein (DUF4415 family)